MSKLDDILDQGYDREDGTKYRKAHKQQIKELVFDIINEVGDELLFDDNEKAQVLSQVWQKVTEL